ncbi:MAG: sialidase family protein [Planctomycetota bacterium]
MMALLIGISPAAGGEEKRLLSFEKEESLKLAGYKEDKGDNLVIRYNTYGSYHYMKKGDATEGEWALCKEYKEARDYVGKGITESGLASMQRDGRILNGCGWMAARGLAGDWSGFDRLRLDIKSTAAPAKIKIRVADSQIVPLPERICDVAPGKWVTLEFDMAAASDAKRLDRGKLKDGQELFFRCRDSAIYPARVLDRAKVYGVFVNLVKCDGPTTILADNLRLVPQGEKIESPLPLVTDASPWPEAEALPAQTKPKPPERPAVTLDAKPAVGEPVLIDVSGVGGVGYGRMHNDRCGIAVADAGRMAISVLTGVNRAVFITADGGKTWKGLDGGAKPTMLFTGRLMMVGACCTPGDDGPDLFFVTLNHCSGGEEPTWVWFKRVTFTGAGWEAMPATIMDVDSWHCPEHTMDVLRLPNGRIWAAWSPASRAGGVVARYSDDDGATWRALGPNLGGGGHGQGRPMLVPYGQEVACFFGKERPIWMYTEDGKWMTGPKLPATGGMPLSGAQLADKELFVAVGDVKGSKLYHLTGGQWSEEKDVPFSPLRLSVSGNHLYAFGIESGTKPVMAVRDTTGTWSAKTELPGGGTEPVADLAVPRVAPAGFLPVAWAAGSGKWVKFLRVPTESPTK